MTSGALEQVWLVAALWLSLALAAAFLGRLLRLPTAVCEIILGASAPMVLAPILGDKALAPGTTWVVFLAGAGALLLTFLAGCELDPSAIRATWRESLVIGLLGFTVPFFGVAAAAHYLLGWLAPASWIAALALSTASVSVVYTIMLDLGLNHTRLGKGLLAASYANNMFTAIAMGAILSPLSIRTLIFIALSTAIFVVLPFVSSRFFGRFHSPVSQPEIRYVLFLLFGLGGLSVWAGGEAVLPAYVMGMVLARIVGRNATLIQHLRVLAFGILTPFYFLRAGAQMQIPALAQTPWIFLVLLAAKMGAKLIGAMPALRMFGYSLRESTYYSLMISTGLALGTIAASVGLGRGMIDTAQYSHIVAAVFASAVVPVAIATRRLSPKRGAGKDHRIAAPPQVIVISK